MKMKKGIVLLVLSLFLASCATTTSYLGKQVPSDFQLDLMGTGGTTVNWQSRDLRIQYNVAKESDSVVLAGNIMLDSSISYSFPIVEFFQLFAYVLDEAGRATDMQVIRPQYTAFSPFPGKCRFRAELPAVSGDSKIAFGYRANFRDKARRLRGLEVDEKEIVFDPFVK